MRFVCLLLIGTSVLGKEPSRQEVAERQFKADAKPFLKVYCLECHSNRRSKGGLNFETALKDPGGADATLKWKQAIANVGAHDMPPDSADQPPEDEREKFLKALEQVKYMANKDPGPFIIRRLTKSEYGNTLHDLLAVDAGLAAELPDEVAGQGYLNSLSPLQTEQYLSIANAALAVTTPAAVARRKELLGAAPAKGVKARDAATAVAERLARLAFRRPVGAEEIAPLMAVFDLGQSKKLSYTASLTLMLKAVLVSPQFLFITPAAMEANKGIQPLDDHQLASRLSYLIWATMPDAELSALADAGKLHEPEVLRAQVKRLVSHKKSRALFDGFGAQWLGVGELKSLTFDQKKFPQMTPQLRQSMYDEARLYFDVMVRENRPVVDFIASDFTFANATLAQHYGLPGKLKGEQLQRVQLADARRGGVLTMGGVLASTSFPSRTSAVKRGVWVLEQMLGEHVPPAPPNVPELEKQNAQKIAGMTLRQRTELHRTNAVCANCHKILDPIGFGLENFDAIGRWREKDEAGGAIDAAGELPSGQRFTTPQELKGILAGRKEALARSLLHKLLAYALCRQLEGYDEVVMDDLMGQLAKDEYRVQSILVAVVTSYPFMNRKL
jgi:hypothetical protein